VIWLWIVGGLVVVYFVGGYLLPREFKVSRSIVIAAPPERVHAFVDDFRKWPLWSPFDTEDPGIVWGEMPQASGVGAKRSWKSKKMGNGWQSITRSDPKTGVAMKLGMDSGGCGDMAPFDIEFAYATEAGGTRVTWTDFGRLPSAPHWRWMGNLLLGSMLGKSFEKGLKSLKSRVEDSTAEL
jgi:carbon monoxide dehydrogenase subunit G